MFRTKLIPRVSEEKIKLGDISYLIGSCFSKNIGDKLNAYKFNALSSPFGVIYNPYSIFKLLLAAIDNHSISTKGIIKHQGVYRHFDFHSDISALTREEIYLKLETAFTSTREQIQKAQWLIITLGTAIVFKHRDFNDIVANCHKIPGKEFEQSILTPEEIIEYFDRFEKRLREINKNIRIIITVSPVRHIKSTLETNSLSKAILRYATDRISTTYDFVKYFPSYEIMMDDLRDYRFYKPDMLHPNEVAIEYIWNRLVDSFFDPEAQHFIKKWTKIRKALGHRSFHPTSKVHQQFIQNTIEELKTFKHQIDIHEELAYLENQLI